MNSEGISRFIFEILTYSIVIYNDLKKIVLKLFFLGIFMILKSYRWADLAEKDGKLSKIVQK